MYSSWQTSMVCKKILKDINFEKYKTFLCAFNAAWKWLKWRFKKEKNISIFFLFLEVWIVDCTFHKRKWKELFCTIQDWKCQLFGAWFLRVKLSSSKPHFCLSLCFKYEYCCFWFAVLNTKNGKREGKSRQKLGTLNIDQEFWPHCSLNVVLSLRWKFEAP